METDDLHLDPDVVAAVAAVQMLPYEGPHPGRPCAPRYFGPRAGIRCVHCNLAIEPDPAVARTAASPSPNTAATLAAVTARGERCDRCGHWTFAPPLSGPVIAGRKLVTGLCRNCMGFGGRPAVVRIPRPDMEPGGDLTGSPVQGDRPLNARRLDQGPFLRPRHDRRYSR